MLLVIIWRMDGRGWYQLLRRFKKDELQSQSISSLAIHPSRAKGRLLVLAQPQMLSGGSGGDQENQVNAAAVSSQSLLRLYDLGSYRPLHHFNKVSLTPHAFARAGMSADGRYAVCGTTIDGLPLAGQPSYCLRFWDTITGALATPSDMSALQLPFPVRSTAWHPRQHMVALAAVGPGAALTLLVANKASISDAGRAMLLGTGGGGGGGTGVRVGLGPGVRMQEEEAGLRGDISPGRAARGAKSTAAAVVGTEGAEAESGLGDGARQPGAHTTLITKTSGGSEDDSNKLKETRAAKARYCFCLLF